MTVYFSHICTRCKTPQLVQAEGNVEHAFLAVAGIVAAVLGWLVTVGLFGVAGAVVATPVFGWLCYRLTRAQKTANVRRRQQCAACTHNALVPVTSPEGVRLCTEIGLQEEDSPKAASTQ